VNIAYIRWRFLLWRRFASAVYAAVALCLSVRLSVTSRYCTQITKRTVMKTNARDSFRMQKISTKFRWDPQRRRQMQVRLVKIAFLTGRKVSGSYALFVFIRPGGHRSWRCAGGWVSSTTVIVVYRSVYNTYGHFIVTCICDTEHAHYCTCLLCDSWAYCNDGA